MCAWCPEVGEYVRVGVADACEPPVGAGNRSQVLRVRQEFPSAEPSFQPPPHLAAAQWDILSSVSFVFSGNTMLSKCCVVLFTHNNRD